jgi:hypothetical protein
VEQQRNRPLEHGIQAKEAAERKEKAAGAPPTPTTEKTTEKTEKTTEEGDEKKPTRNFDVLRVQQQKVLFEVMEHR